MMVDNRPLSASYVARLATDPATAQRLSDAFTESMDEGVAAAAFEDADGSWHFALHFPEPPNETAVRALVALATDAKLANTLLFEKIEAEDWVASSLAGLAPVQVGRFVVHGRHDRPCVRGGRIGIEIEAALAFGTGHHGTTRGCLLALDGLVKRKKERRSHAETRKLPNAILPVARRGRGRRESFLPLEAGRSRCGPTKILDLGTGTGVLAIAAAKALRRRVLASDIDPLAVRVAGDNARLNQAGTLVAIIHAKGLDHRHFQASAPFDLVFANILLGPLKQLARPLARLLTSGGRVVLSGLLPAHGNAALAAYRAQGLTLERRTVVEGWVTLVMRR
jgi:ribosomal protein L11 methyltransferase